MHHRKFGKASMKTESGWLVEKGPLDGRHYYVGIDEDGLCWTPDSTKALRLARKEDAESLQTMFRSGEVRVAEHGWSDFRQ